MSKRFPFLLLGSLVLATACSSRPDSGPASPTFGPADTRVGTRVLVERQGQWLPAMIVQPLVEGRVLIHYENASDLWDEVVGPDRVKPLVEATVADAGAAPGTANTVAENRPPALTLLPLGPRPTTALVSASPQRSAYALVIGIERYRDLPSPGGARADAEAFATVARQTLGIPDANIHVLLDDRATRGDLMKSLEWLKTNVPPNGRVYFFYSGHGAPDPIGASFLVPYDGDPKYLATTALAMNDVMAGLSATKAREVVALVDSCFSGSGGRSVLPPGARPLMRVKESAPQAHLALLTSAGADEIAGPAQGGANGVFSKHLIDGLGRGMADLDGDGQITIEELFTYVRPRVTREAKLDHRDQTPTLVVGKGVVAKDVAVAWNVSR